MNSFSTIWSTEAYILVACKIWWSFNNTLAVDHLWPDNMCLLSASLCVCVCVCVHWWMFVNWINICINTWLISYFRNRKYRLLSQCEACDFDFVRQRRCRKKHSYYPISSRIKSCRKKGRNEILDCLKICTSVINWNYEEQHIYIF